MKDLCPDLGINEVTPLNPADFGYNKDVLMHQLTFTDGTKVNLRFRKFRQQGDLKWAETFTVEHVLLQAGNAASDILVEGMLESLAPSLKKEPHKLDVKLGWTSYGAIVAACQSCFDDNFYNTPESLADGLAWQIESVKSVIPKVDAAMQVWAEKMMQTK